MPSIRSIHQRRTDIALRLLGGLGGGYLVASLLGVACATWLPSQPVENAIIGTLAGLLAWPPVMMGCFATRSGSRACLLVGLLALALATGALLGGWRP